MPRKRLSTPHTRASSYSSQHPRVPQRLRIGIRRITVCHLTARRACASRFPETRRLEKALPSLFATTPPHTSRVRPPGLFCLCRRRTRATDRVRTARARVRPVDARRASRLVRVASPAPSSSPRPHLASPTDSRADRVPRDRESVMAAMLSSSAALAPGARLLNARARKSVGAPRAVPAARVVAARARRRRRDDDALRWAPRRSSRPPRFSRARADELRWRPRTRATPRPPADAAADATAAATAGNGRRRGWRRSSSTAAADRQAHVIGYVAAAGTLMGPASASALLGLRLASSALAAGDDRACSPSAAPVLAARRRLAPAPARSAPASAPPRPGVAGVLRRVLLRGGGVAAGYRVCFGCRRGGARVGAPARVCRPRRARRARLGRRAGARRRAGGDAAGARRAGRVSARVRRRRQRVRAGRGAGEGQEGVFGGHARRGAEGVGRRARLARRARARARLCRWSPRGVCAEPNEDPRARARARTRREEGGGVDSERRAGVRDGARRRRAPRAGAAARAPRGVRRGGGFEAWRGGGPRTRANGRYEKNALDVVGEETSAATAAFTRRASPRRRARREPRSPRRSRSSCCRSGWAPPGRRRGAQLPRRAAVPGRARARADAAQQGARVRQPAGAPGGRQGRRRRGARGERRRDPGAPTAGAQKGDGAGPAPAKAKA